MNFILKYKGEAIVQFDASEFVYVKDFLKLFLATELENITIHPMPEKNE